MKVGNCGQLCSADTTIDANLELNKATGKDFSLGAGLCLGAATLCHS